MMPTYAIVFRGKPEKTSNSFDSREHIYDVGSTFVHEGEEWIVVKLDTIKLAGAEERDRITVERVNLSAD